MSQEPEKSTEKPAEAKPEPGKFGKILSGLGIPSNCLPDSSGVENIEITGEQLEAALKNLRNHPDAMLNLLLTITGVDSADTFDSVYHLRSYANHNELVIKVRVSKASVLAEQLPNVPSITDFWAASNWHERETYDLVGIRYIGHPYLRRILNPWDWEGHPLRRDYKQPVDALNDKAKGSFR